MFSQTSTEELRKAQSCDDNLQPLIQYLKDGTLPDDAETAEKLMRQRRSIFTFYTNNLMQERKSSFN